MWWLRRVQVLLRRNFKIILLLGILSPFVVLFIKSYNVKREDQTSINVQKWMETSTSGCNGNFIGYGNEFARLRYAKFNSKRKTFAIPCDKKPPPYKFLHGLEGTPLQPWLGNLSTYTMSEVPATDDVTTVVVMRIEAHNVYHTLCEWYNVYMVAQLLRLDPKSLNILFLDDRPPGLLDDTWKQLFGKVSRYNEVKAGTVFKDLIWNVIGYESPLNFHKLYKLPFVEGFYKFFIHGFTQDKPKVLNCGSLSVTVILRRDYMTHPERKELFGGRVHRKFQNENEIRSITDEIFQGHDVKYVILENMSMLEQVKLFTNTDILMGMHGAGMSHVLFLPSHAGVFELFPNYWSFLNHFRAFARWRHIKYIGWQNQDPVNEYPDFYTRIPPEIVRTNLIKLKNHLCPS